MHTYKAQIVETIIAVAVMLVVKFALRYLVKQTILHSYFKNAERKDILKIINLFSTVIFCIILFSIWSVKQENILLVASSLLTVFGVALFAEMSILSNITACLILFFQHPIKIGDTIQIMQDGKEVKGQLIDITYFFIFIRLSDSRVVSIPNALLLKSSFTIIDKPNDADG